MSRPLHGRTLHSYRVGFMCAGSGALIVFSDSEEGAMTAAKILLEDAFDFDHVDTWDVTITDAALSPAVGGDKGEGQ